VVASVAVLSLALAGVSAGATLTVHQDGSGDCTAIQPALDAAADGDTILIGPGEYLEETTYRPPGWGYDIRAYGRVKSDDLTIIGAGAGVTVIGPTALVFDPQHYNPKGFHYSDGGGLSVSNLTIRNCWEAIKGLGTFYVEGCAFESNTSAMIWEPVGPGGGLKNSSVTGPDWISSPLAIFLAAPGSGIIVEGCTLVRAGINITDVQDFVIRNCDSVGAAYGVVIQGSSQVLIQDCNIRGGGASGVTLWEGASICEIRDSIISSLAAAIRVETNSRVVVTNSVIEGGSVAGVWARNTPGPALISNCDIVNGTGPVVRCERTFSPVTHDLRNNYWGTSDPDSLAAWIVDINDDPSVLATVLYDPFSPISVPVEKKSLGSFKAMFR
jgi:hypothetical protein